MLEWLNNYFNLPQALVAVLQALILLVIAFIVAAIARWIVRKLLNKTRLKEVEEKAETGSLGTPNTSVKKKMSLGNFIANLVYFIVFMLFVPGIFSSLGIDSVSAPITGFLVTILNYLPNVIGAAIVLAVGILIASLVRMLLVPVFEKIKINKLQEKAGMEVTDEGKLSQTLAFIVYVLILIPVIIMALDVLNISVISVPAQAMLTTVIGFIPNIVAALVLIWIGTLIGKFAGGLVKRLVASSGIDKKVRDMIGEEKFPKFVLSAAIGLIITVIVDIFFIVQGLSVLNLEVFDKIGMAIINYMPNVIAAALIFGVAFLVANFVEKALTKHGFKTYGKIAQIAIMVVAVFMILNQLGIAPVLVNTAFILALGAIAVAFAISFGIGGRDFAKKQLGDLDKSIEKIKEDSKTIMEAKEKEEAVKKN